MNGQSILLVEDDPNLLGVMKDVLEAAGYRVTTAKDGREGLAVFNKGAYSLMILDGLLPAMGGIELLETIRAQPEGGKQPVLMLSAQDALDSVFRAYELGVIEWISKPCPAEKLLAKVASHLKASQKREDGPRV